MLGKQAFLIIGPGTRVSPVECLPFHSGQNNRICKFQVYQLPSHLIPHWFYCSHFNALLRSSRLTKPLRIFPRGPTPQSPKDRVHCFSSSLPLPTPWKSSSISRNSKNKNKKKIEPLIIFSSNELGEARSNYNPLIRPFRGD